MCHEPGEQLLAGSRELFPRFTLLERQRDALEHPPGFPEGLDCVFLGAEKVRERLVDDLAEDQNGRRHFRSQVFQVVKPVLLRAGEIPAHPRMREMWGGFFWLIRASQECRVHISEEEEKGVSARCWCTCRPGWA